MAANSRVPVVNALSDFEHPCQALADFMTIEEHFGTAAGLNFTYVGDGNNVCHSLMLTGAQLGANVTVATPRGYSPDIEIVTIAREIAEKNGSEVRLLQDPQAAVEDADAVYTDVCVSVGFEDASTKRAAVFRPFVPSDSLPLRSGMPVRPWAASDASRASRTARAPEARHPPPVHTRISLTPMAVDSRPSGCISTFCTACCLFT